MSGLDRHTGGTLKDETAHIAHSLEVILTTPKGSRVMRRDFGCDLFEIMDAPLNGQTIADAVQAIAEAVADCEPRIALERVVLADVSAGTAVFELYQDDGQMVSIDTGRIWQ